MNTTIEPRFLALLNDYGSSASPSLELPPLKDPNILKASGRPLPLEPDASHGNITQTTNTQLSSKHSSALPSLDSDSKRTHKDGSHMRERTLGETSPQSLRKILDNDAESSVINTVKKRQNEGTGMDGFLKLPQPPTKKQKTVKQVVPPIIIGLFQPPEPPSQAALFPPIASSSFHDSHGRNSLNTVPTKVPKTTESSKRFGSFENNRQESESKKRPKRNAVKTRKKWTDEETNNLFRGVAKYGSGSWTAILEDSDFNFNSRSATDLKDRYRTCRPLEIGEKVTAREKAPTRERDIVRENAITGERTVTTASVGIDSSNKTMIPRTQSSLMFENILIPTHELEPDHPEENVPIKDPKKRAHRLDTAELVQLGITDPIRGSGRRQRRSYTDDEDQAILQGVALYGRSWCKIRADERLNLQSRTPTDIRDRYKYKFLSNGNISPNEPAHDHVSTVQQKSITTLTHEFNVGFTRETAASAGPQLSSLPVVTRDGLRIQEIISTDQETPRMPNSQHISSLLGFKDNYSLADQSNLDSSDHMSFSQSFDWNTGGECTGVSAPFSSNIGEMDISRLLLDEPWTDMPSTKEKQSFLDINSILTTSAQPLHNGPSFDHMLNFPDNLDDMNGGSFG